MKLLDLHLLAYGPFSDRHLDLRAGDEGLHLVFGLNEAGKSSALRALRALLYGIPERTQDDFLHGKQELRVGGLLRGADGRELACYRRKGRKNTLLDAAGEPIPEERLSHLLGGVDEALFAQLFGIDHLSLVSGGEALLAERGREAEALFGSGMGSNAVHSVLEQLDQEAQSLFAPRASKPLINAQLRRLAELERGQKQVTLAAREWDEARRALQSAQTKLERLEAEMAAAQRKRSALERIRRTLPGLAKRAQIEEALISLGEVPSLPGDFAERRGQAVSRRRLAEERRLVADVRLRDLRTKAEAQDVSESLLAQAEAVDDLREQLGSHRKARRDRPDLVAGRASLEDQAGRRLAEIRPDLSLRDQEQLRPLLGRRRRAAELGGARGELEAAVRKVRQARDEAERKRTQKQREWEQLPPPVPTEALSQAVDTARRLGDIDARMEELETLLQRYEEQCRSGLSALGLWEGDLGSLAAAPLPSDATLRRFRDAYQDLAHRSEQLGRKESEVRAERERTEKTLRALALAGTPPTEADLATARERREAGWRLVKREWVDREDVEADARAYGEGLPLAEAFEDAVARADEISDRLRREAQRVHEHAAAQALLESCEKTALETGAELGVLEGEKARLEDDWRRAWAPCGISPLSPAEMSAWLEQATRLRAKAGEGDEVRTQRGRLSRVREGHGDKLRTALEAVGDCAPDGPEARGLAPLLDHAETRLRALEALQRRRETLQEDLAALGEELERLDGEAASAEQALASWRSEWAAMMRELGLAETATVGEVSDYLQAVGAVLQLVADAQELGRRVEGIDADAARFEGGARALLQGLAPDLLARPLDEAVLQIHARLAEQREASSRLRELRAQAGQAQSEKEEAESQVRAADRVLDELCRQAGGVERDRLEEIERRHREREALVRSLSEIEIELLQGGDGLGIEALVAEAGAADRDQVLAELTAIEDRIEKELQPEQAALLERKVNAKRDFEAMAGGDAASALAEEAQQVASGLRSLAERYLRVKLAGRVLRDEIERFRSQHRDPILSRASGYFATLTCGAFAAIATDFDETDQPVLVAVRSSGERLRVEAMSTGTRDQLYLALRLATLDHYLDGSEPLPFLVDDILIQFDDERAGATLGALADFSARTQVILFTHHRRVVEQARQVDAAGGRVFVHELS